MFKSKKVLLSILAIVMLMFAVGCGVNEADNTSVELDSEKVADNEEIRVVEHAMGKTEIKGTPKRIVTLYQGATDAAIALGVKPVGIVESWVEKPIYRYLRDELAGIVNLGLETQPNLEEIAKLNPDLIVASKLRHEKIYGQLSEIAPTVTHETVFKFKDTVELMGKAMNKEDKANELLSDWNNRVADFKEKISKKLGSEWPVEAAVLNFRSDHARIYVTGYAGDILEELGFVRSEYQQQEAEKGTVIVKLTDKEGIPSMNADVFFIFISDPGQSGAAQRTYEEWARHPLWKNLDAVKAGQLYEIDEVAWNMAGGMISANVMLDQLYEHFGLQK